MDSVNQPAASEHATSDAQASISQLQTLLSNRSMTLHFDEPLESKFRRHMHRTHFITRMVAATIGAVIPTIIVLVDYRFLGNRFSPATAAAVVGGISLPMLLLLLAGLFKVRWLRLAPWFPIALSVYISLVYLLVVAMMTGDGHTVPFFYVILVINIFCVFLAAGLRFVPACAVCFGLCAGYVGVELWAGLSMPALIESSLFQFGAFCAGALACYSTELLERRQFLSARLLQLFADHDPLTGMMNRRAFETGLETAWRQAQRENANLTLAVLDLDHFKRLNDTQGHAEGDRLLCVVAGALRQSSQRPLDLAARLGGDEFIGLWYGIHEDHVRAFVTELHATLNARIATLAAAKAAQVSISLGAIHIKPGEGMRWLELFTQADAALYHAKKAGRKRASLCMNLQAAPELLSV